MGNLIARRKRAFVVSLVFTGMVFACMASTALAQAENELDAQKDPQTAATGEVKVEAQQIEVTRWVDPEGSEPITYAEWVGEQNRRRLLTAEMSTRPIAAAYPGDGYKICVYVNESLYPSVSEALDQYVLDLTGEGYQVELYTTLGGTPADFRAVLQDRYADGMNGCLLVGDLPVPWFEADCWDDPTHEEFPCDLFYMDMDGAWADADVDGLYDSHSGDVGPEIWVGRLTASPLTLWGAQEANLVNNYFAKNHLYRSGLAPKTPRGLVYVDDDWSASGPVWMLNSAAAFNDVTLVDDQYTTWHLDYEDRLALDYEHVCVYVHSSPELHQFVRPGPVHGYTYNTEVVTIDPPAAFYNLFACSNSRYVESNYMGGWYVFTATHGLASIGSTKTGSMLSFDKYYTPLGQQRPIGLAFMDWFEAIAAGGFEHDELCWHYGMTLCGDPTLTLQQKSTNQLVAYNGPGAYGLTVYEGRGFSVRCDAPDDCELKGISVECWGTGTAQARVFVWEDAGGQPGSPIDSIDMPAGTLQSDFYADFSASPVSLSDGQSFHIGFKALNLGGSDELYVTMDNGDPALGEYRSYVYDPGGGTWSQLYSFWNTEYNFLIQALLTLPAQPEVTITTLTLPHADQSSEYNTMLAAEGGTSPYTWELTAGSLPAGLSLGTSSGEISGTPTEQGVFPFTVGVTDASMTPLDDVQHLSLTVEACCGMYDPDSRTGNVDQDPANVKDLTDILALASYAFLSGDPCPCMADMNVSGDAGCVYDLTDILALASYAYMSGPLPAYCLPECE